MGHEDRLAIAPTILGVLRSRRQQGVWWELRGYFDAPVDVRSPPSPADGE
jgi:hypothetical protein